MKNVKKLITVVAPALLISSLAFAAEQASSQIDTSWLQVQGEVNMDYFAKDSQNYSSNLRAQGGMIKISADVAKGIKAAVKLSLDRDLRVNGTDVASGTFDMGKFIEQAYVEIKMDELTGTPVAVIIGKDAMAFGQQLSHLPMYKDNLLYKTNTIDKVIGVTVKLDNRLLGSALDSLEVSAFENGADDLKIGDGYGLSVRLSKQLSQSLKLTASAAEIEQDAKENSYSYDKLDKRAAVGIVYDNGNGTWKAFAQGTVMKGSVSNPSDAARLGATAGVAINAGPGEVVMEYSYLERQAQQVALAYNLPLGKNLTISPEVRYTFSQDSGAANDTQVGVRAKASFGNESAPKQN